jgi:hypothetical protein
MKQMPGRMNEIVSKENETEDDENAARDSVWKSSHRLEKDRNQTGL